MSDLYRLNSLRKDILSWRELLLNEVPSDLDDRVMCVREALYDLYDDLDTWLFQRYGCNYAPSEQEYIDLTSKV